MELEHSFTVPVPEDRAWEVLLDVKRVAPCMPGASLDSVDGDDIKARIKVKVGPIAMTYAGTAKFTERDPQAHIITLVASGKETRGAGTASATVRSVLEGDGDQTHVIVHTTLNVTGRPAQFGRGVMAEVGGKLIGIFASNLAEMLSAEQAQPPADEGTDGEQEGDQGGGDQGGQAGEGDQDQMLESLNLTMRSYNSLRREGIHTVADLAARTREQLLAIENIGPASVEEIKQKLADRGLTLSDSPASANGIPSRATSGSSGSSGPPTVVAQIPAASAEPASPPAPPVSSTPAPPVSSTPAPPVSRVPADDRGSSDDDAIDLLSVAGSAVLKRAIPVAAALAAAVVVVLRIRIKRRRSRS
jgi:carbon monoxide dehydrogenase subunit G